MSMSDPRGHADDPLARRPAFAGARDQAAHRRARLPYAGRGAGRHAQHGGPMVRRGHRRDAQPHGHAHGSGQDVDRAPRRLAAHGPRHPCIPFGAEGRRVVDHVARPPPSSASPTIAFAASSRTDTARRAGRSRARRIRFVPPICRIRGSSTRSPEQVARVASIPRTRSQCFQALKEGGAQ